MRQRKQKWNVKKHPVLSLVVENETKSKTTSYLYSYRPLPPCHKSNLDFYRCKMIEIVNAAVDVVTDDRSSLQQ